MPSRHARGLHHATGSRCTDRAGRPPFGGPAGTQSSAGRETAPGARCENGEPDPPLTPQAPQIRATSTASSGAARRRSSRSSRLGSDAIRRGRPGAVGRHRWRRHRPGGSLDGGRQPPTPAQWVTRSSATRPASRPAGVVETHALDEAAVAAFARTSATTMLITGAFWRRHEPVDHDHVETRRLEVDLARAPQSWWGPEGPPATRLAGR